LPGWSVEKVARLGAAGVKLLVYYHPDAPNAPRQEALVREVGEACSKFDMPFFLEPLSFSLDPAKKKLATADKLAVVVETARRLSPLGVDVLKAEFPLDIAEERDEGAWATACAALSEASMIPWVLLSAGVSYETFERQVLVACQNGASGVLAGRAVWKEAVWLYGDARTEFLNTIARGRMNRLSAVVLEHGRAWTDHYPALADSFGEGWYKDF
jgi:tagatose 1,6-diphosphate aldolase